VTESLKIFCLRNCGTLRIQVVWHVSLSVTRYFSKDRGMFICKGQAVDSLRCQEPFTVQHSIYPKKTRILSIAALRILRLICGSQLPNEYINKTTPFFQLQQHYMIILHLIPTNCVLVTNNNPPSVLHNP
jgi:hypothetical protein